MMNPKVVKTKDYIEFFGHYDDVVKCAKLSALATLWSIEAKYGYIKFPIEYEEQINKVLECDKLYAGLNSLGLRTYTTNTSSLLYNYKLNKTFSSRWVVNSNTNFNGKYGNYIWYDGTYYNCYINYPNANYRYVNGVWSTYNNGYTSIPSFTGTTVFYTKNNTFFGNGNNNGNGWYKFENGAFVKKASDADWRNGYYTWTDGTNTYHDGLGGNSGTSTSKQYMQWVFNESNCSWSTKAWTGLTSSHNVYNVWTDGDNIYLSQGYTQLVLNKTTSTWESKSWSGLSSFTGEDVWTDGHDIYYSANSNHYVLDKKTSTWKQKTWTGLTSFNGRNTWTDGVNLYYSVDTTQYILEQVEITPLTKTYNLGAFRNNSEDFNQIIVNGTSIDNSTFYAIDNIHYINTSTSSNVTVYSDSTWASGYNSILDYITTAPSVTTINNDCNSIVTFTTRQVALVNIVLGSETLLGIDTIKVKDAADETEYIDFKYGNTPSSTTSIKIGDVTLTGVGTISVTGTDSTQKTFGYKPASSWAQVTITASDNWYSSSYGEIHIYEGQDATGQVLLNQIPANKNAYPINLNVSGGYLYIEVDGAFMYGVAVTSNDFTITNIADESIYYKCVVSGINVNGTININVNDFDD